MCYYFNVFNFRKVYHFQKYIDTKIFFLTKNIIVKNTSLITAKNIEHRS
jgi:hypothetical protein